MRKKFWYGLAGLAAIIAMTWLAPGCGHSQELASIDIQPTTETFGASDTPVSDDAGLNIQLRALGNYSHPPVTKDITNKVTWTSNTPTMVTVNTQGVLTATGEACGNALVSATLQTNNDGNESASGAIITGSMTANVVCFTATGAAVTVNFAGTGLRTVASSPAGFACSSTCTGNFAPGTTISLTANPNGSNFGGWAGCDSVSGQVCSLTVSGPRTVTVTSN
jgi:hypothetical protein